MNLPDWVEEIRPMQQAATDSTMEQFLAGNKVVMLDAPTGSGKTLIGEMVRQMLDVRGLYLCSTLDLQTQFANDFPEAAVLRGRSNYPTYDSPNLFPELTASDCVKRKIVYADGSTGMECQWCDPVHSCPYERAKASALRAKLACSNLTYFLYESNFIGNLAYGRGLVVIDEADLIEDTLLNFVTVSVSQRQQRDYALDPPEKKTVAEAWVEWAAHAERVVGDLVKRSNGFDLRDIRKRKTLERLFSNLKRLNDEDSGLAGGNWVYTGYDRGVIEFKPIKVDQLAKDFLWRHGQRFLLMSATTISFAAMADSLGIE